ncbi:MAG: hypothetical protein F6K10_01130 [Moorea sp. SIO2B7]|nr:hypothetical protein [Moorena sp. SIO2B7]
MRDKQQEANCTWKQTALATVVLSLSLNYQERRDFQNTCLKTGDVERLGGFNRREYGTIYLGGRVINHFKNPIAT